MIYTVCMVFIFMEVLCQMKVKNLVTKYFESIFNKNKDEEMTLYKKLLKKSLKGKKTQRIR